MELNKLDKVSNLAPIIDVADLLTIKYNREEELVVMKIKASLELNDTDRGIIMNDVNTMYSSLTSSYPTANLSDFESRIVSYVLSKYEYNLTDL